MKLTVSAFQLCPQKDIAKTLDKVVEAASEAAKNGAGLILLPELFPFGILKNREEANEAASKTPKILSHLKEWAGRLKIAICGGLPFEYAGGSILNSMFLIPPEGPFLRYDKLHLFPPFNEPIVFKPGKAPKTFCLNTSSGQVLAGPMICYDIRFPELARRLSQEGASLLMVSSLWPLSRKENLITLLRARAMENQCFLVAANVCGRCGNIEFAGASLVAAPDGSLLSQAGDGEELILARLDIDKIQSLRAFFNSSIPKGIWNFPLETKIIDIKEAKKRISFRKKAGQRVVFTNGCFDILHAGHVSYLRKARAFGDVLVVGLNSDESIRRIKGPSRPVNRENERAKVLSALSFVDMVVIFSEDTPERLIHEIEPDVLVKGADWEEENIVGADFVKARGGNVKRIAFEEEVSTTGIIERIKSKT